MTGTNSSINMMNGYIGKCLSLGKSVMNKILVGLFIGLALSAAKTIEAASVCIPAMPGGENNEIRMSPPGVYIAPGAILHIKIDRHEPAIVSPARGARIDGLSSKKKHPLRITTVRFKSSLA